MARSSGVPRGATTRLETASSVSACGHSTQTRTRRRPFSSAAVLASPLARSTISPSTGRSGDVWVTDPQYAWFNDLTDTPPQLPCASYRCNPRSGAVLVVDDTIAHPNDMVQNFAWTGPELKECSWRVW
ncbi:hypothetical protein VTN02DRAFT_2553 [Thermoascus thermophilus]